MTCWTEIETARAKAHAKHGANIIEGMSARAPRWLSVLVEEVGEALHENGSRRAASRSCCRFPKSCSCTVYDEGRVSAADLETPRPIQVKATSSQAGLASFVRIGWVPPDFSGRIRRIDGDSPLPQQVTLDDLEAEHRNGWSAFHPEDFCHRCGNRNLCWWTPAETWNRVMRGGDPAGWGPWHEIICIPCFIELAEKAADRGRAWHLDRDENGSIRLRELGDTDLGDTEPQPVETRVEWGVKACGDGHVAGADEDLARSIVASCTSKRTHCALVSRTVTVGPWTEVAE